MDRIKKVNVVFLMTAMIPLVAGLLPSKGQVINLLLGQVLLLLPTIGYLILTKSTLKETIRLRKISISNVFLLMLLTYLMMPLMNLISAITLLFTKNTTSEMMLGISKQYPFIVGLIAIAIIPCLFEETVYRGVFYNEYRKVNVKKGILMSAFLFGILHGNLNQFAYAFVMGIIFALVIEATDSIVSTMIMHFIFNGTSVVMMYVYPKLIKFVSKMGAYAKDVDVATTVELGAPDRYTILVTIQTLLLPAFICSILAFFVYRVIARNSKRYEHVKQIFSSKGNTGDVKGKERLVTIPLLFGIGLCTIYVISNFIYA